MALQRAKEIYDKAIGTYNPFLKKDGSLFNKYVNYQALIDNPNINERARELLMRATGLTPTQGQGKNTVAARSINARTTAKRNVNLSPKLSQKSVEHLPEVSISSDYASNVGKKVAGTDVYNNGAAKGQCVWYVRGRMKEKFGKDWGSAGNANEVYYGVPEKARLTASADNIKPDTVASFRYGTSEAGKKYGHVIYIEDVVGDTVYYTEGGSGYHKRGTDGVVKATTKQDILNGTGSYGSGLIGLVDITKI